MSDSGTELSSISSKAQPAPEQATASSSSPSNGFVAVAAAFGSAALKLPKIDAYAHTAQSVLGDKLPKVTISYKDVSTCVVVPADEEGYEDISTAIWNGLRCAQCFKTTKEYPLVDNVSGVIRPGTMTLVIAPPGHGKTSFLKLLAGRATPSLGSVHYNGCSEADWQQRAEQGLPGAYVSKLCQYVEQVDVHLPLLTVKETLQFVKNTCSVDLTYDQLREGLDMSEEKINQVLKQMKEQHVDAIIDLLELQECEDVILGNALIRGVSGGQRRRVTIGEALVTDARAFLFDEITNGLDAAVAINIIKALRKWTKLVNGTMVAALQQASPEIYEQFDDLVLLREGKVVFHGKKADAEPYFQSLGVNCPNDVDFLDFIVAYLAQPKAIRKKYGFAVAVPVETTTMVTAFKASAAYHSLMKEVDRVHTQGASEGGSKQNSELGSVVAQALFGSAYSGSMWQQTYHCISRQATLMSRNKALIGPRIGQGVMMGVLMGTLFWQISPSNFFQIVAILLLVLTQLSFGNMVELPIAVEAKRVVYKQMGQGLYPSLSYVVSVIINHFPLVIAESLIFGSIVYWSCGLANDTACFIVYMVIVILTNTAMSVYFRVLSVVGSDEASAQSLAGPSSGLFMLFGGFFITASSIPSFMIWLYWISPFSWLVRALSINQFHAPEFQSIVPGTGKTAGNTYLDAIEMYTDDAWVAYGCLYIIGFWFLCSLLQAKLMSKADFEQIRGTKRYSEEEDPMDAGVVGMTRQATVAGPANDTVVVQIVEDKLKKEVDTKSKVDVEKQDDKFGSDAPDHQEKANKHAIAFVPATLAFRNIEYSVYVENVANNNAGAEGGDEGTGYNKKILRGIHGVAKPGKLLALMGASGAGKTTLIDILANRKTQGTINGNFLVDSKEYAKEEFAKIAGYVEQFDSLLQTDTVRETLMVAAKLRLPTTVSEEQQVALVDEIMDLLELNQIADTLIGGQTILGLSPSQLKLVTCGVELVANPAILFLDEPTTGLDSRSAMTVMRVVRKIAKSGRTVICTIHQPSAELFYMFDELLLLASGGYQVFFGPLGEKSASLVSFLTALDGVSPRPATLNPAAWMLDVVGEVETPKLMRHFEQHEYHARMVTLLEEEGRRSSVASGSGDVTGNSKRIVSTGEEEVSLFTQYWELQKRFFRQYTRDVQFIGTRLRVLTILGVVFGLTYFNVARNTQAGMMSTIGVIVVAVAFVAIIHAATSLPTVFDCRAVFYRERASNMYHWFPYSTAAFLIEVPTSVIGILCFNVAFYSLVGLRSGGTYFLQFFLTQWITVLTYVGMTHFLSAAMPNKQVAGIFQGVYFSLFIFFSGVTIPGPLLPSGWVWLWRALPLSHTMEAALMPQFDSTSSCMAGQTMPNCGATAAVINNFVPTTVFQSEWLQTYTGYDYNNYGMAIMWIGIFLLIIRILTSILLATVTHIKR